MAFPNVTDIVATTIESRTRTIRDNVSNNTALMAALSKRGNVRTFSGGTKIYEEISFAENGNGGWYNGYDLLPVGASDVLTAAEFEIKQAAVPVVCSGLELLQNAGREQMIDLLESRIRVAEATMTNLISAGIYSDGTTDPKEITGLDLAVKATPATGTYGEINAATWTFWRNKEQDVTWSATNIQENMNTLYANLTRNADRPDLIVVDDNLWGFYVASLQAQQRFHGADVGNLGFPTLKYMGADVILDGGIGGSCPASTGFMLNTKYLHYRPHAARNMVSLSPRRRYATNQDAEVQILAWAGNLTCSGRQFQGRMTNS